jgi:hypothetical protein
MVKKGVKRKPDGYWTLEKVCDYLRPYVKKLGRMLTNSELRESHPKLVGAIYKVGGNSIVTKKLQIKSYKNDYLTFDMVSDIIRYCFKNTMPTDKDADRIDGLRLFIRYYGRRKLARKLGIILPRMYKNIKGELVLSTYEAKVTNFMHINKLPYDTEGYINKNSRRRYDIITVDKNGNDVYIEIWGMIKTDVYEKNRKIKEDIYSKEKKILISIEYTLFNNSTAEIYRLLTELMSKYNIKNKNFAKNINDINNYVAYGRYDILKELKDYCIKNKLNKFPSAKEWYTYGYKKHIIFLNKHKYNLYDVAKELGFEPNIKKRNYWDNPTNIIRSLQKIIDKLGKFPSTDEIGKNNTSLSNVITKKGIKYWAKKMGYKTRNQTTGRKGHRYWANPKNIKKELQFLINSLGKFPTVGEIIKAKKRTMLRYIYKKGIKYWAKKMGYKTDEEINGVKEDGYWNNVENFKKELFDVINNNNNEFPNATHLKNLGRSDLHNAIRKLYGSLKKCAASFGYILKRKKQELKVGKWDGEKGKEKILNELRIIAIKLGKFPSQKKLFELKRSDLVSACYKHDGVSWFRDKINKELFNK